VSPDARDDLISLKKRIEDKIAAETIKGDVVDFAVNKGFVALTKLKLT